VSPRLGTALRCLGFHGHLENVEDGGAETSAEPGTLRPVSGGSCLAGVPSDVQPDDAPPPTVWLPECSVTPICMGLQGHTVLC
jgi:hypothetical protein